MLNLFVVVDVCLFAYSLISHSHRDDDAANVERGGGDGIGDDATRYAARGSEAESNTRARIVPIFHYRFPHRNFPNYEYDIN